MCVWKPYLCRGFYVKSFLYIKKIKLQHRSEKNKSKEAWHSCTETEERNQREALKLNTGTWKKTGRFPVTQCNTMMAQGFEPMTKEANSRYFARPYKSTLMWHNVIGPERETYLWLSLNWLAALKPEPNQFLNRFRLNQFVLNRYGN